MLATDARMKSGEMHLSMLAAVQKVPTKPARLKVELNRELNLTRTCKGRRPRSGGRKTARVPKAVTAEGAVSVPAVPPSS